MKPARAFLLLVCLCLPWLGGCQDTGVARWELSTKIPQGAWSDPDTRLIGYARRGESQRRFFAAWRSGGHWQLADAGHVTDCGPRADWPGNVRRADPLADRVLSVQPFFDGPMPGAGQDFLWRPPVPNAIEPVGRDAAGDKGVAARPVSLPGIPGPYSAPAQRMRQAEPLSSPAVSRPRRHRHRRKLGARKRHRVKRFRHHHRVRGRDGAAVR